MPDPPLQCINVVIVEPFLLFFKLLSGQHVLRVTLYSIHHNRLDCRVLDIIWQPAYAIAYIYIFFFWNPASVSLTALLRFFIGREAEKCVFRNPNVFVGRRFYNEVKQRLLWGINVCLCSSMVSPRVWNKHAAGIPLISQRGRHICGLPFICWRGTKSTQPVWRHERLFLNQRVFITCF